MSTTKRVWDSTIPAGLTVLALILILFLAACGGSGPGEEQKDSPFAATGLTAHPKETAEEILVRAHNGDVTAMVLAFRGYVKGIGGFPEEKPVARGWALQLAGMGEYNVFFFCTLQQWEEVDFLLNESVIGPRLAECEMARQSPFGPLFKKAWLFDLDRACGIFETAKAKYSGWEKGYQATHKEFGKKGEKARKARKAFRELTHRPATPEDMAFLDAEPGDINWQGLAFSIATSHDPETGQPDWQPDWQAGRLLEFMDMQAGNARGYVSDMHNPMAPRGFADFMEAVGHELRRGLAQERNGPQAALLLQKAHKGDIKAIREVADHYRNGTLGFPQNSYLGRSWLLFGADQGDEGCYLEVIIEDFAAGEFVSAWLKAHMILAKPGDPAVMELARRILEISEEHISEEEKGYLKRDY